MKNVSKPNISIQFKSEELKVLQLKGHAGDQVPKHKVSMPAILCIINGKVTYRESNILVLLQKGEYKLIHPNIEHDLAFETSAEVELILFPKSQLKFL